MQTATDPCPLCLAPKPIEAQRQNLPLAGLGRIDIGYGYCGACGHIYQLRSASPEMLSRHYQNFSNYTCFDANAARTAAPRASTRRLLGLAETHAPKRGLAYEVGCATGFHLEHFRRAGWRVAGCDLSPKAAAQAAEIFAIEVDCGSDAQCLPKRKDIDLIYFSHVLEHMSDPITALRHARAALADDGMVMLEVPCAIAPEALPPGWFTFEHLHYFSQNSLLTLLAAAGFRALEFRVVLKAELYPVIAAIAVKAETQTPKPDALAVRCAESFLRTFCARDSSQWAGVAARLSNLKGGIYVWGAGVHTAQLFAFTPLLTHTRVLGIVDRDSQKWGHVQAEFPIISPDEYLTNSTEAPVVISSYAAEAEITRDLRQRGVAENRIVQLYH